MPGRAQRRVPVPQLVFAAAGAVCLLILLSPVRQAASGRPTDFLPLYVAARLAPSAGLYDREPFAELSKERFGQEVPSLVYTRPPFYALVLKPLGWMSYETAQKVWLALGIGSLAAFVWLWPSGVRTIALVAVCWSLPVFGGLLNGQDAVFLPIILLLAYGWRETRPLAAGLALSLCAIKFNRFLTLPLLFLSRDGRPLARGFVLGVGAEVALSFVAAGWSWPRDYLGLLRDPATMQVFDRSESYAMPTLHGLVSVLGAGRAIEIVLTAGVFLATAIAVRRMRFAPALACVLLAGVLTSVHAFIMDWTIVLFCCLLILSVLPRALPRTLVCLGLLASPVAFMQLMGPPLNLAPPILLLCAWTMVVVGRGGRRARPDEARC